MVDALGNLSGPGNQQVFVQCYLVGQNGPGNYSQYYAYVEYRGNGYGSWSGSAGHWSLTVAGQVVGGSFTIPYDQRNGNIGLWSGYFNVGHDGSGNLGSFLVTGAIDYSAHGSIGAGSASVWEPAAPRIAKRPGAPGSISISNILPTSFRVNFTSPADHGGSPVDFYLLRVADHSPADSPPYEDFVLGASPRVVTGRQPGKTYRVVMYSHNGSSDNGGYSNKSAEYTVTLPAGIYVSNGSAWVPTSIQVSSGTAWAVPLPQISDGDSWEAPINV